MNPKPDYNLTTEFKNEKNNRKADGALLNNGKAVGVIELKGTNTKDLESIRKQAFDYKANQKGCVYVITSNFEKLRFYINDATEFLEFNLFMVSEEEFALLYLCLHKDALLTNLPLKIKEESITQEEQITKKFYADYSVFKRELFRDLVKQNAKQLKGNPSLRGGTTKQSQESDAKAENTTEQKQLEKNVKLSLFKKSQKLIDRFLFIFFAEDRGLLPANSTVQILNKWKADNDFGDERPLYDLFKQYFHFLDSGRKGTNSRAEIYAYNGGLFKPDSILDTLVIDDKLLYKHTLQLANYDFESQVDVNILGHIFENSLNEIESVNAEIEGSEFDKQKSKRKKDGVFYTPKYITKYIVENTVGKLCEEKKQELGFQEEEYFKSRANRPKKKLQELIDLLDMYREWLLQLTICDPACGSGAFLNQALDFLIKEHRYIDELKATLLGSGMVLSDIETTILENNIYGVDLNEESVEIAKLSLWLRTAQPRRKLNDLSSNIKCGNSLIDDKKVAGEKAFNWEQQFPHIFKQKEKKAFHITTAIHDSRTSDRMVKYKVREKRAMGTNPYPNVIYFTEQDDLVITQTVADIVKEHAMKVLAYNICADHFHLLVVCDEADIPKIMQKVKGRSSYNVKGLKSLVVGGGGADDKPLWAQKYYAKPVTTETHLHAAIDYIAHNRAKHELPDHSREIHNLIDEMCCSYQEAFKEDKGGFDVVIGNPPYGASFSDNEKTYISKKYKSYQYKFESYIYFYEVGLKLLKANGYLSFITPELFLRLDKSENIRELIHLKSNLLELKLCGEHVFQDVKVNSVILTLQNTIDDSQNIKIIIGEAVHWLFDKKRWGKNTFYKIDYEINPIIELITTKIKEQSSNVGEYGDAIQGLTPYDSYRGQSKELIKSRAFHHKTKIDESCGKWLDGKNVTRYFSFEGDEWLQYGDWLASPREKKFFTGTRLLFREIPGSNKRIQATLVSDTYYYGHSLTPYLLDPNLNPNFIYVILALVNSKLISWYASYTLSNFSKNTFPKLNPKDVKSLPISLMNEISQQVLIEKSKKMLSLNVDLQENMGKFLRSIQRKFGGLEKLPRKLENWYELSYAEFIKELAKKKIKLTLAEEAEWEDYFFTEQGKAVALKTQIDETDRAIDGMVYELYGLTEEEILIVENS